MSCFDRICFYCHFEGLFTECVLTEYIMGVEGTTVFWVQDCGFLGWWMCAVFLVVSLGFGR